MRRLLPAPIDFFLAFVSLLFFAEGSFAVPTATYRVVIDPGHGGVSKDPKSKHGDKFDTISQSYLEAYKQGTESSGTTERKVVLSLAKELHKVLKKTETEEGWKEFRVLLDKYSIEGEKRQIRLVSHLTRVTSFDEEEAGSDPNKKYRLYDFPDENGKRQHGRLSSINAFRPNLVVSLHMNPSSKGREGGMASVLTPGYKTFSLLKEISEGKKKPQEFLKTPWSDWMVFVLGWTKLENAIADAWIYFHGYWSDKSGKKTDLQKFEGYRQNMVTWAYQDAPGWESKAKKAGVGPYAKTHSEFSPKGKFWEREKSPREQKRREGGREGFGGDNFYASQELLRYVQYGMRLPHHTAKAKLGPIQKPYISTYSLPTYTNAICAFLEIGYINKSQDVVLLTQNKAQVAEALAVGIYSLFVGLKPKKLKNMPYTPHGKRIEWESYGTYFEEVVAP